MSARTGLGILAVILAAVSWFAAGAAVWVAMAALVAATVAAALQDRVLAGIAIVLVVANTFFIEPTLWALVAEGQPRRSRTADAYRIFLLALMAAPAIAMAANRIHSRLTDRLIAALAFGAFAGFLVLITWRVPQLPLAIVFGLAIAMAAYDFWRDLGSNGRPGSGQSGP